MLKFIFLRLITPQANGNLSMQLPVTIAAVKMRYRRYHLERAVDLSNVALGDIY